MASAFAHPLVAVALLPWFRREDVALPVLVTGVALTLAPDADVAGFGAGVPHGHALGHRGLTHSLPVAAAMAGVMASLFGRARPGRLRPSRVFLFLFLCMASHGLLDAFTNGGLGIAFFAPLSNARYFFPWTPIEVSPLDADRFFTARGLVILGSELLWVGLPCVAVGAVGWMTRSRRLGPERPVRAEPGG
jgi:inner membrane protein